MKLNDKMICVGDTLTMSFHDDSTEYRVTKVIDQKHICVKLLHEKSGKERMWTFRYGKWEYTVEFTQDMLDMKAQKRVEAAAENGEHLSFDQARNQIIDEIGGRDASRLRKGLSAYSYFDILGKVVY